MQLKVYKGIALFLAVWMTQSSGWAANETLAAAKREKSDIAKKIANEVTVTALKDAKSSPFLPAVQGTKINSGKKTSNISLADMPTLSNNNYRQALAKTPGLLLSEESSPLVSVGYRGLEPHRGQFTQMMEDGVPIHADMFGYPEAYYTPVLQTVENIEFIRGGASLMYGPQPGGALNYVTRQPVTDKKFTLSSENIFGSDNLFSTYEAMSGTVGPLGYLGYFHERQADGFRNWNSDFEVISSGMKVVLNQTGDSRLTLSYNEYHEEHGEPGGLVRAQFDEDPAVSTREFDRFRLERYYGSLHYEKEFSEATQLDAKIYGGHYRRYSKRQRGGGFGTAPVGVASTTNDIEEQDFYNLGFEPRLRHDYELFGEEHTLSVGAQTFMSHSPRTDMRGGSPSADTGDLRKDSDRDAWYFSVFLENLFRWGKLSVTPGVRLEHLWQRIQEQRNLDKTTVPLADEKEFDFAPLFGIGVAYEIAKAVELYTNFSQAYRPKIFSQSVPLGTNQTISSDLTEGKSWQYDVGLRGRPVSFVSWDVDYFLMSFRDQIGTVGSSVENVGDARHQGMEFYVDVDTVGAFDYFNDSNYVHAVGSLAPFVTLTVLSADFTGGPNEGRQPQYAPQYNLRTGIHYIWRERIKVSFTGTFLDDHYADDASTQNRYIPSYKVWDLTGELSLLKNVRNLFDLSVFGGINNIFDEHYYARVRADGIDPAYGRNIYGGVKLNLG